MCPRPPVSHPLISISKDAILPDAIEIDRGFSYGGGAIAAWIYKQAKL